MEKIKYSNYTFVIYILFKICYLHLTYLNWSRCSLEDLYWNKLGLSYAEGCPGSAQMACVSPG